MENKQKALVGLGITGLVIGGIVLLSKQAKAAPPTPTPWAFSNIQYPIVTPYPPVGSWLEVAYSATITNIGNQTATKTVWLYWRRADISGDWLIMKTLQLTLSPGQDYLFTSDPGSLLIFPGMTLEIQLRDSDGEVSTIFSAVA